jgi:UDP-N-acetylglucosamine--N-acetylmuramyl-(pentapeptide) pyrophosphoryl-undecaprenol N-acetylglucosamine transferase
LVISRAGANTVYELIALSKNHILVPLSKAASRGDQIENAEYSAKLGYSTVINDEDLNAATLKKTIDYCRSEQANIQKKLSSFTLPDSFAIISNLLEMIAKSSEKTAPSRNRKSQL